MSYISSLNLLGDDSPTGISEEALTEELSLWANAQFTFDREPGSALLDEHSLNKQNAEQSSLFDALAHFPDLGQQDASTTSTPTLPPFLSSAPYLLQSSPTTSLPLLAPAPTSLGTETLLSPQRPLTATPSPSKKRGFTDAMEMTDTGSAVEEDKRKRNTAASARFRMKKKLREQALEQKSKEMASKVTVLEKRIQELETEAKWLRALVVEKDPKLLDAAD